MSAQQNTKTRRARTQTTLLMIWLTSLAMIEKTLKHRLKKEIFITVKNIVLIKTGLLLVFFDNFLSTMQENNVLATCISY